MDKLNQLILPKNDGKMNVRQLEKQYAFYQRMRYEEVIRLDEGKMICRITSEANRLIRSKCASCAELGIRIREGDICFIDFGDAYLYESGYQHFGLIVSLCHGKALVVPMTSNTEMIKAAYDPITTPQGKRHLMRIGLIKGMARESVLFLNDAKFINTARIIDVKAKINRQSPLFQEIKNRLKECMRF